MRRIALLSDVHGNRIALEAVLADIDKRGGADETWVLGDLAAIGPDPVGVLERLRLLPDTTFVRGNTDRYLVTGERPGPTADQCRANPDLWPARVQVAENISWTQGAVTAAGWVGWLAERPLEHRTTLSDGTRVLCVHASPGHDDGHGVHPELSEDTLKSIARESEAQLLCVGHTHWPVELTIDGVHIINVGSVSNPFAPDLRASYALLESDREGYRLQLNYVDYDHEAVVKQLQEVNHPVAPYIIGHMRGEHRPYWWPRE